MSLEENNLAKDVTPIPLREMLDMLVRRQYGAVKARLIQMNPADIANEMGELDKARMMQVFRLLPQNLAAEVFAHLDADQHRQIVDAISIQEVRDLVDQMFVDDAVDFLEDLPADVVRTILNHSDHSTRSVINHFLKFRENSAGSLMTVEFVSLFESMNCRDALAMIRHAGVDKETIYTCYVTDTARHLIGAVSLRKILIAKPETLIRDIMHPMVISVSTNEDQEAIAHMFQKYDLIALPVLDPEGHIVGIITIDDIVDVIEAEQTEDIEKMAAIKPSENEYLKSSIVQLAGNRLPWLLVMMLSTTLAEHIIEAFNRFFEMKQESMSNAAISAVFLAAFIPMLMGTGGNCGSQASTLIVRSIAIGDISLGDWAKVLMKELRVGMIVGIFLACANLLRVVAMGFCMGKGLVLPSDVDIIVSISLFAVIVFSKLVGGSLPLLAVRYKVDPALMASPMVTTIIDICALLIFYGTVTLYCC